MTDEWKWNLKQTPTLSCIYTVQGQCLLARIRGGVYQLGCMLYVGQPMGSLWVCSVIGGSQWPCPPRARETVRYFLDNLVRNIGTLYIGVI